MSNILLFQLYQAANLSGSRHPSPGDDVRPDQLLVASGH